MISKEDEEENNLEQDNDQPRVISKPEKGTLLQQMLSFFIKQNSKTNMFEPNTRYEQIDAKAEEVSSKIDKVKDANKRQMR